MAPRRQYLRRCPLSGSGMSGLGPGTALVPYLLHPSELACLSLILSCRKGVLEGGRHLNREQVLLQWSRWSVESGA